MAIDDELIDDIYEELLFADNTKAVLKKTADLFGGHAGSMIVASAEGRLSFVDAYNMDAATMLAYHSELSHEDQLYHASARLPIERPFSAGEMIDLNAQEKTDFYEQVLEPSDLYDAINMRFLSAKGVVGFSIFRPKGELFQQQHLALSKEIYPHLRRAFALHNRRRASIHLSERAARYFNFTLKEKDIVELLCKGFSYSEVEAILRISKNTLKWHLKSIFQKVGVSSLSALLVKLYTE